MSEIDWDSLAPDDEGWADWHEAARSENPDEEKKLATWRVRRRKALQKRRQRLALEAAIYANNNQVKNRKDDKRLAEELATKKGVEAALNAVRETKLAPSKALEVLTHFEPLNKNLKTLF